MAHEAGHIAYGDSMKLIAMGAALFVKNAIGSVYHIVDQFLEEASVAFWPFLLLRLMTIPCLLADRLGDALFATMLGFSNRCWEYRADRYAASLGYKHALIGFLTKLNAMQSSGLATPHNFLWESHPLPMERVSRMQGM